MSYEAFGDDDDGHLGCYSEEQVQEHEQEARAEERARIVTMMRTDYPMNQHAREWADWIEKLTDWPSDGTCRKCGHVPRHPDTGLCATCTDEIAIGSLSPGRPPTPEKE